MASPTLQIYRICITPKACVGVSYLQVYVAADFVGAAIKKAQRVCADQHFFRPSRANCLLKTKRLNPDEVVRTPEAFASALALAASYHENDVVKALRSLYDAESWLDVKVATKVSTPPQIPHLTALEAESRLRAALRAL